MRTNKKLALEDETYLMQSSYRTTSQATSRRKGRMKTRSMGDLRRSKHAGTKYLVLSLHTPPDLFSLLINFLWGGVGSAVWWCRRFKPGGAPPQWSSWNSSHTESGATWLTSPAGMGKMWWVSSWRKLPSNKQDFPPRKSLRNDALWCYATWDIYRRICIWICQWARFMDVL